jgi:hypothetical protein
VGLNDTTLKDLMDRALAYADFPKDSLDADQQKTLINDINDGLIELWEALIDSHEDLVHKIATLTLVSNTEAYNLPSDFYKAIKVWYTTGGRRYRMERFNLDEIDGYPKPVSSGTGELWYAPPFARLKLKKATVPDVIPVGWENYGAMFAACRLLISEGTDPQGVMAERERLMNRIRQDVGTRDEQPDGLSDYYGRWDVRQDLREAGYTRMLRYRIIGRQIYFVEIQLGGV